MGTITGQVLADNAAGLIHDVNRIRWTDADWLQWLNDGQREAVVVKPDVYTLVSSTQLTADSTLQTMPVNGLQLFAVSRNMGADGNTPGRAINVVSRDVLDTTQPDWHTEASVGYVNNYMYDPRAPKNFYVYPKAPATAWYVELHYSAVPTALSSLATVITLDDVYANALINYMLFRAHSRDEIYGEVNRAADIHYNMFLTALGAKLAAQATHNPNLITTSFSAETQASAAKPAG